jgi:hypothetical protein
MSPATTTADVLPGSRAAGHSPAPQASFVENAGPAVATAEVPHPDSSRAREHFIPVTRFALIDRLTRPQAWPAGIAGEARRFFRYLDYWRHQQHNAALLELEQLYEPFSPDSDLFVTRQFTDTERQQMRRHVVEGVERLLKQANYVRIDPRNVGLILTRESHYGLDLYVDLKAFDELLIYYRGASTQKEHRRTLRKFLRKQEFEVPIFRRLFVLFKLKPFGQRVEEVMREQKIGRREAEKEVRKLRSLIPSAVRDDAIYMKMFKNMPRADLEMIFPNTRVRFRLMDKIKLGVTSGAGIGMGMVGAAGKVAIAASNPITAAGAVAGLGAIAFRQAVNFMNQRQRYMVIMAQNLYFHSMADNRGVMIKLADRAAEEDVKEEILLYSVLAKETVNRRDLTSVDEAIERFLASTFDVVVDFDVSDALARLIGDGLVREDPDGTLRTLPPREAALHIDRRWDEILDRLPDLIETAGVEVEKSGDGAAG